MQKGRIQGYFVNYKKKTGRKDRRTIPNKNPDCRSGIILVPIDTGSLALKEKNQGFSMDFTSLRTMMILDRIPSAMLK